MLLQKGEVHEVAALQNTDLQQRKKGQLVRTECLTYHSGCQQEEEAIGTAEGTEGRTNSVFLKMGKS